jgi:hypothetical protein
MTDDLMSRRALFPGLVYNEVGQSCEVVYVGGVAHYVVPDDGFLRHVEAYLVDDAIIAAIKDQVSSMEDEVVMGMLQMLGKDDIFTKAALNASIRNLDQHIKQGNPDQWVPWLRLFGFRVVVNVHGEVVDIIQPTAPDSDDE